MPDNAHCVFKGKIFEVWQWEQQLFDGTFKTFERLKRADTAQTIAVVGDKILVQDEQQPDSDLFISLPGGQCDDGEDPLESAKRELHEETGYESDDWELFNEQIPSGKIEWVSHTFIARNCRVTGDPHLDAGEKISPRFLDFEEFIMLSDNPLFRSVDLASVLLRMRLDPEKKEEFRKRLFG